MVVYLDEEHANMETFLDLIMGEWMQILAASSPRVFSLYTLADTAEVMR